MIDLSTPRDCFYFETLQEVANRLQITQMRARQLFEGKLLQEAFVRSEILELQGDIDSRFSLYKYVSDNRKRISVSELPWFLYVDRDDLKDFFDHAEKFKTCSQFEDINGNRFYLTVKRSDYPEAQESSRYRLSSTRVVVPHEEVDRYSASMQGEFDDRPIDEPFQSEENSVLKAESEEQDGGSANPETDSTVQSDSDDFNSLYYKELEVAFPPATIAEIARIFRLKTDKEENLKKWRAFANRAKRNGLAKARITTTGSKSTFNPLEVAEWLSHRPRQDGWPRDRSLRALVINAPLEKREVLLRIYELSTHNTPNSI